MGPWGLLECMTSYEGSACIWLAVQCTICNASVVFPILKLGRGTTKAGYR
jgi:hypothetical protein